MEDLIFHLFFVVPLTRWITGPDRSWNKKSNRIGIILAVGVLFCIGVLQSGRENQNHYETLGVDPTSPPKVVAASYRKLSLAYHPDRNPHPDAKETFAKIREANEILSNEKRRNSYCRFGDFSAEGEIDEEQFYDVLFLAVFQFLIPLLFAYVYTYGADSAASRQIFCCYGVSTFCLELLLRFDSRADHILSFVPFIGHLLPFEKIKLMHAWMPVVLNGLLLLGSELADTEDDFLDATVRHVVDSHLEALLCYERFLNAAEAYLRKYGNVKIIRHWLKKPSSTTPLLKTDKTTSDAPTSSSSSQGDETKDSLYYTGIMKRVNDIADIKRRNYFASLKAHAATHAPGGRGSGSGRDGGGQKKLVLLTEEEKRSLDQEEEKLRKELKEAGYIEFIEVVKPWRLHAGKTMTEEEKRTKDNEGLTAKKMSASERKKKREEEDGELEEENEDERRDYWLEALRAELPSWPSDLKIDDLATRAECTERGWDKRHEAIVKLLDEVDGDEERTGRGISIGTIIFFGSLFLRWYSGSS